MDFFKKITQLFKKTEALNDNLFLIGNPETGELYSISKEDLGFEAEGMISGVGTGGYIPLWISGSVIGTSAITENGVRVIFNGRSLHLPGGGVEGVPAIRFGDISAQNVIYLSAGDVITRANSGRIAFQAWGGGQVGEINLSFLQFAALAGPGYRMLYANPEGQIGSTELPVNDLGITSASSNYTLALIDRNSVKEMNVASANTCTVPPDSSVAFPVGSQLVVTQTGVGQTTIVPGSGVTIRSADNALKLRVRYSACTLIKRAANDWFVHGDLTLG